MAIQEDPDNGGNQRAMATEAIAAVSDAAIRRGAEIERNRRRKALTILLGSVVLMAAVLGTYRWVSSKQELPVLADVPVAILLPKIDSQDIGVHDIDEQRRPQDCADEDIPLPSDGVQLAAKDNACRQKEGFDAVFSQRNVDPESRHYYYFEYANLTDEDMASDEADHALRAIKTLYERGVRVFIITMSGAVKKIQPKFEEWADKVDPRDRPILIATVASAPGIANRERGVLRHYIRSKDEVAILSTYIESTEPAPEAVGIFRVNDEYGQQATKLLINRLEEGLGITKEKRKFFKYGPNPEKKEVEDDVQKLIEGTPGKIKVAVIVGYGKMISSTLESLRVKADFKGPILVVSTFTEKRWRPCFLIPDDDDMKPDLCPSESDVDEYVSGPGDVSNEDFAGRIHTVGPDRKETDADYRGVVYQFSYMTLDRVLRCTDELNGANQDRAELFWECWSNPKNENKWAEVEYTADGDSHVTLKLLDYKDWK
jgi:hypothetical protein